MLPTQLVERFLSGVRSGDAADCWPYVGPGSHNKRGWHRVLSFQSRRYLAHRLAYEIANGPIPVGLCVLHKCDNPVCCNPAHLFLGTRADNAKDMWDKQRGRGGAREGHRAGPSPFRGITRASLEWAVEQYKAGATQVEIAESLGVSDAALGGAFCGRTYKDLRDVVQPIQHLLGRATKAKVAAEDRANQAVALRQRGLTQREIAAALGVCQSAVSAYLRRRNAQS